MSRKKLAGPAFIILTLTMLVIGGPSYGTFPSAQGIPSAAERQTPGEGEGGRTQEEKAGGTEHGEEDGGLQGKYLYANAAYAGLLNGSYGTSRERESRPGILQECSRSLPGRLGSREDYKQNVKRVMERRSSATEEASKTYEDNYRHTSRGTGSSSRSLDTFLITAYTAGEESTGKRPGDKNYGVTATGTTAHAGRTISADWRVLPPGTTIEIEGLPGTYTVEDSGGGVKGKHIDLFINNLQAALEWGRQYREVRIIK